MHSTPELEVRLETWIWAQEPCQGVWIYLVRVGSCFRVLMKSILGIEPSVDTIS